MNKNLMVIIVFLIPVFSSTASMTQVTNTIGTTEKLFSNTENISLLHYKYYKNSYWVGGYTLEAFIFENGTMHVIYKLNSSGMYNTSNGEGKEYFPYLNSFDRTVDGLNWTYITELLNKVNSWNYVVNKSNMAMCDGGQFTEQIELFNSNKNLLNSSVYRIDNDSCSGMRSTPDDYTVIIVMSNIKLFIMDIINEYHLTTNVTNTQSLNTSTNFNFTYFIISLAVLVVFNKLRKKH